MQPCVSPQDDHDDRNECSSPPMVNIANTHHTSNTASSMHQRQRSASHLTSLFIEPPASMTESTLSPTHIPLSPSVSAAPQSHIAGGAPLEATSMASPARPLPAQLPMALLPDSSLDAAQPTPPSLRPPFTPTSLADDQVVSAISITHQPPSSSSSLLSLLDTPLPSAVEASPTPMSSSTVPALSDITTTTTLTGLSLDYSANVTPRNYGPDVIPEPRRRHRSRNQSYRSPSMRLAAMAAASSAHGSDSTLSKSLRNSPVSSSSHKSGGSGGGGLDFFSVADHHEHVAKQRFEQLVRRYYYQLVVGCGDKACPNRLCRSNSFSPKMTKDAAAILSVQLANRPVMFFCRNCPQDPHILMPNSPLALNLSGPAPSSALSPLNLTGSANGTPSRLFSSSSSLPLPSSSPRGSKAASRSTSCLSSTSSRPDHHSERSIVRSRSSQMSHDLYRSDLDSRGQRSEVHSSSSTASHSEGSSNNGNGTIYLEGDNQVHDHGHHHLHHYICDDPDLGGGKALFTSLLSVSAFSNIFTSMPDKCWHPLGHDSTSSRSSPSATRSRSPMSRSSLHKSFSSGYLPRTKSRSNLAQSVTGDVPDEQTITDPDSIESAVPTTTVNRKSPSIISRPLSTHTAVDNVRSDIGASVPRVSASIRRDDRSPPLLEHPKPEETFNLFRTPARHDVLGLSMARQTVSGNLSDIAKYYRAVHDDSKNEASAESSCDGQQRPALSLWNPDVGVVDHVVQSVEQQNEIDFDNQSLHHRHQTDTSVVSNWDTPPQSRHFIEHLDDASLQHVEEDPTQSRQLPILSPAPIHPSEFRRYSFDSDGGFSSSSSGSDDGEEDVWSKDLDDLETNVLENGMYYSDWSLPYFNLTLLKSSIATYNLTKESRSDSPLSSRLSNGLTRPLPQAWVQPLTSLAELPRSIPTPPTLLQDGKSLLESINDNKQSGVSKSANGDESHQRHYSGLEFDPLEGVESASHFRACSGGGDSAFLVDSLRTVFSSAEALGSSFLVATTPPSVFSLLSPSLATTSNLLAVPFSKPGGGAGGGGHHTRGHSSAGGIGGSLGGGPLDDGDSLQDDEEPVVNVGGIDIGSLREGYDLLLAVEPARLFGIEVTNAMEMLLAHLEIRDPASIVDRNMGEMEMRAIIILLMNPYLFEQPYQETLLLRILRIFVAFPDRITLIDWLSHLDGEGIHHLASLFKMYLSAHFITRVPGPATNQQQQSQQQMQSQISLQQQQQLLENDQHPAVCAVRALDLVYQANEQRTLRILQSERERQHTAAILSSSASIATMKEEPISFMVFYADVMEELKFKEEYAIWRSSWFQSDETRQFSYFSYPFLFSPSCKAQILNIDAMNQMSAQYEEACVRSAVVSQAQRLLPDTVGSGAITKELRSASKPYLVLELSRHRLVEEAFDQIVAKHSDLKKPLKIVFVDAGEEGMDQGGLTKEFFQLMVEKIFEPGFGLFQEISETRSIWLEGYLDGSSRVLESEQDQRARLVEVELVGILIGLALYNGVILGVRFPKLFYRKLLDWPMTLECFIDSFPTLGKGLQQMLDWTDGDVTDVFMRSFEISYEQMGQVTTLPLMPGGEDIDVTNENRQEYVEAYMNHYANIHVAKEFEAFRRGFEKVCGGEALKILRPEELEMVLCGSPVLNMNDLESVCQYDDGYSPSHRIAQEFWSIVHNDMSFEQHQQLLMFVTGSDRVPIRGLKDLVFVIQRNGPDSDRLPTALTCFSRLLMPEYANREKLKERLVTAIENSNGFGLV